MRKILSDALISALGAFGASHCLLSVGSGSAFWLSSCIFLLVLAGTLLLGRVSAGKRRILLFSGACLLFLLFFLQSGQYIQSFLTASIPFIQALRIPYDLSLSAPIPSGGTGYAEFFFVLLAAFLFISGHFSIICRLLCGIAALLSAFLCFYFGLETPVYDLILIAAYQISLLSSEKCRTAAFISACLIGTASLVLIPESSYVQPKFFSSMQESILSLTDPEDSFFHAGNAMSTVGIGSDERVRLGNVDGIHYTGRAAADIQAADADRRLYLRSRVSGRYESSRWEDLPDAVYTGQKKLFEQNQGEWYDQSAWLMETIVRNESLLTGLGNYMDTPLPAESLKQDFSVAAIYGKTPYYLIPYNASFGSDIFIFDRSPRGNKEKIYTTYLWRFPAGAARSFLSDARSSDPYYLTYKQGEKLYRDFVYKNYLDVPPEIRQRISALLPVPQAVTDEEKREWVRTVRQFLSANYTYSTHPGKVPADKDFISYFLTERKEGYCTYFASAAVMMLRAAGIPARYVSGLTVSSQEINHASVTHGLHFLSITDRHAHAWAEVYVDGIGWRPCEMTPGIEETEDPFTPPAERKRNAKKDDTPPKNENPGQSSGTDTKTPQQKESVPQQQPPHLNPDIQPQMQQTSYSWGFLYIFLFSALVAGAAAYFLRKRLLAVPSLLQKATTDPSAFNEAIRYAERLAAWAGYAKQESYKCWVERVSADDRFVRFDRFISILTEAKFSRTPLSAEKQKEAVQILAQIRKNCLSHLKGKEKWLFRLKDKL